MLGDGGKCFDLYGEHIGSFPTQQCPLGGAGNYGLSKSGSIARGQRVVEVPAGFTGRFQIANSLLS